MESKSNNKKSKFDKKKWREKKYDKGFRCKDTFTWLPIYTNMLHYNFDVPFVCISVNKWEEKRQKIIIQKYNRILKKNNATHTSNDDVKGRMASKKSE